ncbi:hypothetical protein K505DRAFT_59745 [Melanomma pulvis-pyrius CBS 109.77]|uniref:Secreted protein n=1 Tax=Melanomma pulvis-pyrius CBS 109.77 TaxID=1314802 RepID=A0A6A6X7G7_9PLEO|nr:hypothetical protein K505DRAFT_59745 [Melanomma pulvis-pyrius CBS 109.77]
MGVYRAVCSAVCGAVCSAVCSAVLRCMSPQEQHAALQNDPTLSAAPSDCKLLCRPLLSTVDAVGHHTRNKGSQGSQGSQGSRPSTHAAQGT